MNEREYDYMYAVEDRHWWYVALHELTLCHLAREGRRDLSILDAGCGTGRLLQLAAPFGHAIGCDFSVRALDFCCKRGVEVFAADLNTVDLGVERYDVIMAIDVLYHQAISDDAPVLASFFRALKPGGLLLLNLVAYEWLRSTHDVAVHTRKRYNRKEFLPLLKSLGFRAETISYRLGFLLPAIAAYRLAKRFLDSRLAAAQTVSDVGMPPLWLNRLLLAATRMENRFILRKGVPFGSSLFVATRKPLA